MIDPAFLRARKEAIIILISWGICLVLTVGISGLLGYRGQPVTFVWGIPLWVFLGVLVPWLGATAFSVWFSLRYIRDE